MPNRRLPIDPPKPSPPEKGGRWGERVTQKIKEFDARVAARKAAEGLAKAGE